MYKTNWIIMPQKAQNENRIILYLPACGLLINFIFGKISTFYLSLWYVCVFVSFEFFIQFGRICFFHLSNCQIFSQLLFSWWIDSLFGIDWDTVNQTKLLFDYYFSEIIYRLFRSHDSHSAVISLSKLYKLCPLGWNHRSGVRLPSSGWAGLS